jgi:hypothetical protein
LHVPHVPTAKPGFKSQRGQAVFIFSRLNWDEFRLIWEVSLINFRRSLNCFR